MTFDLADRRFWIAREEEIKDAKTTDVYFINAAKVVKEKADREVLMETYVRILPYNDIWAILTGTYEVLKLLEGLKVDVWGMEEGELFLVNKESVVYEPVLQIRAKYADIACYENPILGFLSSSTSISTKAARVKVKALDKPVLSFGSRRVHPSLAPMVERATYIAGFDGVSNVLAAKLLGIKPVGTMPHAMIQTIGDREKAWKAFDEIVSKDTPRIAIVDTFGDEKEESILAVKVFGDKLYGIRLDTPASRRGSMKKIIEEVRWELNIREAGNVKIFVSGGIDEDNIEELKDLVDGFGVGTTVSAAPAIDFSAKVVEVYEDEKKVFRAKRGDIGGRKVVLRKIDEEGIKDLVVPASKLNELKIDGYEPIIKPLMKNGKILIEPKSVKEIREGVLKKLRIVSKCKPILSWRA
jgi:nicotinate phosphoribosyltransferase